MRRIWLATVLATALLSACSEGGPVDTLPSPTPAPVSSYDAATPVGLAAAGGKVWTVEADGDEVTGRSSPTDKPVSVHVGATPLRAASDGRLLWVTVFGAGRVVAIDPARGRVVHRVRVPGEPEGIVAAFGGVWVVRQKAGLLTKVTPSGVGPSYHLGDQPRVVAADGRYLFASNFGDGTVTRVDPRTRKVTTSKQLCIGPQDMVAFRGVLWVTCTPDDLVVALDPATLRPLGKVKVAGEPDAIQVVGSELFVVTTTGPTLVQMGTNANHPGTGIRTILGEAIALGDRANVDAVHANGHWWVSSPGENRVVVYPR